MSAEASDVAERIDTLYKLAKMHEQGLITRHEFDVQKHQLLNGSDAAAPISG